MTENKRFKLHIKWFNPAKTNGEATLKDNGQPILCTERIEDARLLKNLLNELYDENEQLKNRIDDYNVALKTLQDLTERKINENKELKSKLFEVEKDYILETYADNTIRRDEKLKALSKEFDLE